MIGDSFQHSSDMLQQDSGVLEHFFVDSVPGDLPEGDWGPAIACVRRHRQLRVNLPPHPAPAGVR